ncbi:MAG: hypothetical protein ABR928_14065 [Terracidiphilus sp.]
MAQRTNPANGFSTYEKREELRRVVQSKLFSSSPKKIRFLEFISEQSFQGNSEKLNEYLIGTEVYDRGADFDQQKDPIVRVQAHEIRRLLKKYYEEEGRGSLIRMELPAGHYVPVFTRLEPENDTENGPESDPENGAVAAVPAAVSEAAPAPQRSNRALVALTVILAALCLALSIQLARRGPTTGPAPAQHAAAALPPSLDWFWHPFLPPAAAPLIVIPNHPILRAAHGGDSQQTIAAGHEIPKASLPEFRDTIHFRELKRFIFVPSVTDFTSVGETIGLVDLCEMFFRAGDSCQVSQSRLVDFEQIKNNNTILLGGNQSWSGRVFLNVEGFHFQDGVIINRSPQPGEEPLYKPEFDPVTNQLTRDYALVLMLPNEKKENRVLLIYGIYTQGSQAAIEFLFSPEQMAQLRNALAALSPDHKTIPPYFQVLLTTTVENGVPGDASIVAVRAVTH